jgi:hypothetical protein
LAGAVEMAAEVVDHNFRALLCQQQRLFPANSPASARDNSDFAF